MPIPKETPSPDTSSPKDPSASAPQADPTHDIREALGGLTQRLATVEDLVNKLGRKANASDVDDLDTKVDALHGALSAMSTQIHGIRQELFARVPSPAYVPQGAQPTPTTPLASVPQGAQPTPTTPLASAPQGAQPTVAAPVQPTPPLAPPPQALPVGPPPSQTDQLLIALLGRIDSLTQVMGQGQPRPAPAAPAPGPAPAWTVQPSPMSGPPQGWTVGASPTGPATATAPINPGWDVRPG